MKTPDEELEVFQKITTDKPRRIQSVDLLRGAVMIIMAIDHVRVYAGVPAGGPTADVFFTRWITHYCAPAFAFFAGTSAFLFYQRSGSKKALVNFLVTRGLLLVVLELTVIRFFWMFNLDFSSFVMTGVIWMLGWCMVLLSLFVSLRPVTLAIIGLVIIFGQQAFHYVPVHLLPSGMQAFAGDILEFFYPPAVPHKPAASISPGLPALPQSFGISVFYVIIPWIGVMMAGYGFGQLITKASYVVKRACIGIGVSAIVAFLAAGTIYAFLGNANQHMPFLFRLLGQQKYPPTQLYLLMTLGPLTALVPWAEKVKGRLADALRIVGRVPMFYYLLHILLIHLSAFVVNLILFGSTMQQSWYATAPFVMIPEDQRWSLGLLYAVWAVDIVILYYACRWYADYKIRHPEQVWTKYI